MGRPREISDDQILRAARRCFLQRGAGVSAADIAGELGVSHTTLFNRFGSKEGLMLAALGPPKEIAWVRALEAGPDERPIRDQLVDHVKAMASYFRDLQAGFGVLQAAGIDPRKAYRECSGESAPEHTYRALVGFLKHAQREKRLAKCDVETLATALLATLHGWTSTTRACGSAPSTNDPWIERFVDLLWEGIGPD